MKEDQDFNKSWDDEANTEDIDKQEELAQETDVKESSSSDAEQLKTHIGMLCRSLTSACSVF